MADKAQTTWTCDRCKSQWQTLTDHNAQPERWHRLMDANPPRHAEPEKIGDVCEDCWTAFCSWWQNSSGVTMDYSGVPSEVAAGLHRLRGSYG